jgi:hypothetical protein
MFFTGEVVQNNKIKHQQILVLSDESRYKWPQVKHENFTATNETGYLNNKHSYTRYGTYCIYQSFQRAVIQE